MKSRFLLALFLAQIFTYSQPVHESGRVDFLSGSSLKMWLALNHYKPTSFGYKSEIDDLSFFTSKNGLTNPQEEFNNFIKIIRRSEGLEFTNALNRFPARSYFVMNMLGITNSSYQISVASRIKNDLEKTEVSLIYASLSFKGLSSALGHAFLKTFDPIDADSIYSSAIYYSANSGGESGFGLILNGLTGGYNGQISKTSYLTYIKEYLDKDNRDLHEYKVIAKPQNLFLFYLHIEEISSIKIKYRFIDSNCVSQLIPLVNILINGDFFNLDTFYIQAPSDVVLMMEKNGVLKKRRTILSRYSLICDSYRRLGTVDKNTIRDREKNSVSNGVGTILSEDAKRFYSLYKSYQFDNMEISDQLFVDSINNLGSVNAGESSVKKDQTSSFPEFKLISSINAGYATDFKRSYYQLGIHPVSIKSVDSVGLLPIGSEFSILNIQCRIDSNNLNSSLQRFDLVDILNIPKECDLIHRNAWGFYLGGDKRIDPLGHNSFLWRAGGKYGKSALLADNFVFYGLVTINMPIDQRQLDRTDVETGLEMGCSLNQTKYLNARINCEVGHGFINEYNFLRGNAIFQRNVGNEIAVGIQYSCVVYFGEGFLGNDINVYFKRFF